jgi:hypothetical protein
MGCGTLIDADSKTFSTFLLSESMAARGRKKIEKKERNSYIRDICHLQRQLHLLRRFVAQTIGK